MKISVLSHDLSHNCLGRAHVLARLLMPAHEVEIVGPALADGVWEPLRDQTDVPIRRVPLGSPSEMARHVDGDILYAVKPKSSSLGVALAVRRLTHQPVIADVDDWEMSFFLDNPKWMARNLVDVRARHNVYRTAWMEHQTRSADAVTVSSTWLASKFKGTVVVHARDTATFDPDLRDGDSVRREFGLVGQKIVLFLGSPRPHKGLSSVMAALDKLSRDDLTFLVVGGDPGLPPRPYLRVLGRQPFDAIPDFLAAADVVVLAQERTLATKAQMPAKLYDAMAMGRAIVATDVSDLGTSLNGCGLVVPVGDTVQLSEGLERLLDNPELREELGRSARKRCMENYSLDAVRPVLQSIISKVHLKEES
jgi:glycosyltransferase involved in cell wall biosynthesis